MNAKFPVEKMMSGAKDWKQTNFSTNYISAKNILANIAVVDQIW